MRSANFAAVQQSSCFVHEQTEACEYSNRQPTPRHEPPCQRHVRTPRETASSKALQTTVPNGAEPFSTISVDNSVHILYIRFLSNAARRLFFAMHKFATAFLFYRSIGCIVTSQYATTQFSGSPGAHLEFDLVLSPTFASWTNHLLRPQCRTEGHATF